MKAILRGMLLFTAYWTLFYAFIEPCQAASNVLQRRFGAPYSSDIPFLAFPRHQYANSDISSDNAASAQKILYVPGGIMRGSFTSSVPQKIRPTLSRAVSRRKLRPEDRPPKGNTGITLDLDAGYGNGGTFISRLQHGTQFKGAHYTLSGHVEYTEGSIHPQQEQVLTGEGSFDVDLSKRSELRLNGSYFFSDRELPQFSDQSRQKKSAIQAVAHLRVNPTAESPMTFTFGWEHNTFADYTGQEFFANRYRSALVAKYLWGRNDTVTLQGSGIIEHVNEDEQNSEMTVIADTTLINTFVWRDTLVIEVGGRFAYFHTAEHNDTISLLAPLAKLRVRLGETTTLYATYQPALVTPLFSDLYINTLYASVNSNLYAETMRHAIEFGIQQRFGKAVASNIAAFYQEREHPIALSDENLDYLLSYTQGETAQMFGMKVGVQIHFLEQFVHALSYTYADYGVVSPSEEDAYTDVLPYQPHHSIQANLSWLAPQGFEMDISGMYISAQYRNWQNADARIGGRFLVNISFSQMITEWAQVYARVRNLTDTAGYEISPILDNAEVTSSRMLLGGIRLRF